MLDASFINYLIGINPNMPKTLSEDQQGQILQRAKNMMRERERIRTLAKSGFVSAQKRALILKDQETRFCDFLREL